MLGDMLSRVARDFIYERGKPFNNNSLANFIRKDLAQQARKELIFRNEEYKVKGSPGSGNWAAVPWLGFFDPIITESAQNGFYVVYLFNVQTSDIYLSLNQGTTAVYREFGDATGRSVLKRRAIDIRDRIRDLIGEFSEDPIFLGSNERLPSGYEAGHAIGKKYSIEQLASKQITEDLHALLDIYQALIERGGLTPTDVMFEQEGISDIDECRKSLLTKRIERSRRVRRAVLASREPICQACGLDPQKDYEFTGRPENIPLDVHHMTPLGSLAFGETRHYKVPDDFLVLCPTCHRMIHKQPNPSSLEDLKRRIRFKHMREIF